MKLRLLLSISAIYMALLGFGFIFVPQAIGIGAVPPNPSAALTAYLRVFGSTFIAIALMNAMARNAEPSTALRAILLANIVGFGSAGLLDLWGLFSGARQLAIVFATVHLVIAIAFIWLGRASMPIRTG